jgi:hypothetical protein
MRDRITRDDFLKMGKIVFVEGDSHLHGDIRELYDDFVELGIPCEKIEDIYNPEQQAKFFGINPDTIVVQSTFIRSQTMTLFNRIVSAQEHGEVSIKNVISVFDSGQLISACNALGGTYIQIGMKIENGVYDLMFNTLDKERSSKNG